MFRMPFTMTNFPQPPWCSSKLENIKTKIASESRQVLNMIKITIPVSEYFKVPKIKQTVKQLK